jgi:single-strand DNA-binding protein
MGTARPPTGAEAANGKAAGPGTAAGQYPDRSFNIVVVAGVLATEVRVSELPSGGVVHNFDVRTDADGVRHLVPVAWHDPSRPPRLAEGDPVLVSGVVRRRWFRAGGTSQSRTEVLAATVARAGSKRAETALGVAMAALADGESPTR